MDALNPANLKELLLTTVADLAMKVITAIIIFVVGRWLIGWAVRLLGATLQRNKVDKTLLRYANSVVSVTLNILLIVGLLGYFGVQTATFAALFAAAGVAIGMAWSGLLAHFAAGVFLIVLRPFKTGDFVTVAGVTGTVREIGLFATIVDTADNIHNTIGNNKILSDNIVNFSSNGFRRVEIKAQLSGSADIPAAIAVLKEKLASIPNVLSEPKSEVEILEFNLVGPVLVVRPYCQPNDYWQVYFDTNKMLLRELAQFPAPVAAQTLNVRQVS
ncbi:MAG: mechanosensitive ion channel family protein [Polyangiaceae bacterium]|nr:mechanosensitive ion channel family protein [Polyangiaceae bacterium]